MHAFAKSISIEMGYSGKLVAPVLKEVNRVLKDYGLDRHIFEVPKNRK